MDSVTYDNLAISFGQLFNGSQIHRSHFQNIPLGVFPVQLYVKNTKNKYLGFAKIKFVGSKSVTIEIDTIFQGICSISFLRSHLSGNFYKLCYEDTKVFETFRSSPFYSKSIEIQISCTVDSIDFKFFIIQNDIIRWNEIQFNKEFIEFGRIYNYTLKDINYTRDDCEETDCEFCNNTVISELNVEDEDEDELYI